MFQYLGLLEQQSPHREIALKEDRTEPKGSISGAQSFQMSYLTLEHPLSLIGFLVSFPGVESAAP